jgi:RNA recognition motif-containing protein
VTQTTTDKDTIDERSIFVKEVDYHVTSEELMSHFNICGEITRLRILTNRDGTPKGYIYVFFVIF